MEALPTEASGEDAYLVLQSTSAFSGEGGTAVIAPGTSDEEEVTYSHADPSTNRLVGLTRPTPLSHSAGVRVQPSESETPASPAPEPEGEPSPDGSADHPDPSPGAPPTVSGDAASGDPEAPTAHPASAGPASQVPAPASAAVPDACELLFGKTCLELGREILEGNTPEPCMLLFASTCEAVVSDVIDQTSPDVCMRAFRKTCEEVVDEILHQHNPDACSVIFPIGHGACEALDDPLGPWSACDVDGSGAECPDAEDVIDLVWSVDNPLSDLQCTASVEGPAISSGGGMVKGRGIFDCGEAVQTIEMTVCLHRRDGGVWLKMGCRKAWDLLSGSSRISKRIAEPCAMQRSTLYRIRARGVATDGPDEDRDAAKATAELYCPGTSVDGADDDALEYAESWLPTGD